MNFENDPIAEKVQTIMRKLKSEGVSITGGSQYNRVFEAFYSLVSERDKYKKEAETLLNFVPKTTL